MDFSKLSQNQQITVGAAVAMFLIGFFPWYGVPDFVSWSGWDSGFSGVVGIVLIVAAGVILVMESMDKAPVDAPAEIGFYLTAAGAALIVYRLLFSIGEASRRIGMILAIIAAGAALWGAYRNRLDNS